MRKCRVVFLNKSKEKCVFFYEKSISTLFASYTIFCTRFCTIRKKNRTFCLLYINIYSKMLHKCEFCSTFVLCMHFAGTYY